MSSTSKTQKEAEEKIVTKIIPNTNSSENQNPDVVEDLNGMIKLLSDGSIIRHPSLLSPNPNLHDDKYRAISSFDFVYDSTHNLHLRVYRHELRLYKPYSNRPPTITLYIHGGFGGSFCLGSRAMAQTHNFCLRLSKEIADYVVSVDYRLAPENRLPAAVDDVWNALKWVRDSFCEDDELGQFGRVVIFGDSAGGNIAHNLAVRIGSGGWKELEPVRVMGYVLLAPMFGGGERTKSELEGSTHTFFNLDAIDRYWRLAIPIGETTDYPLMNPFGPRSPNLEQLLSLSTGECFTKMQPVIKQKCAKPRLLQSKRKMKIARKKEECAFAPMLIMVGGRDLLRDRVKDYANRLSNLGTKVEYVEFEGLEHGFLANSSNPEPENVLLSLTKKFINENSS